MDALRPGSVWDAERPSCMTILGVVMRKLGVILPAQPETTLDRIVALRRSLDKAATYEFHYHQADDRVCRHFFETVPDEADKVFIAVLHKRFAPADFRRLGKMGVYSHALAGLGLRAPFPLSMCKLHLDGSGRQKAFLQTLKTNIRWACRVAGRPQQSFKDIRLLESAHPLIQYADMVTGAVAAYVNGQDTRWFTLLSAQSTLLWHERFEDNESNGKTNSPG